MCTIAMQEQVENRSAGREPALIPCKACQREIPRGALTCIYCGHAGPAARIRRTARIRRNAAKCRLGALIMLGGFVSLFYFLPFPMNLVVGVTALIFGAAMFRDWRCGGCGARVDREAVNCPRCALPFAVN